MYQVYAKHATKSQGMIKHFRRLRLTEVKWFAEVHWGCEKQSGLTPSWLTLSSCSQVWSFPSSSYAMLVVDHHQHRHCFYCSKNFLLELPLYPLTHFLLPYSEFTLVFAREVAFLCCSGIWKYEYPWLAGQIGWKKLAMNDWGMSGVWSWCRAVDSALWWRQTVRGLIHPASPAYKLVPDVLWITRETPCL